jgi:HAD superfamily hydrolase (TIGR01509 family)
MSDEVGSGRLAGVIFDVDGLLIDTEPVWLEVELAVFGELGVVLTAEDCRVTTGLRNDEVVRYWYERRPWSGTALDEVERRIIDAMAVAIATRGTALPGAVDAVELAGGLGVPVAVASSSPMRLIEASLQRLGLVGAFVAVVSAENEPFGKPHPGVYRTTVGQLGVDPHWCVALEDSPNGGRAAKAAGMACIGVPTPEHHDEVAALADLVLPSLVELTADHLRTVVSAGRPG